MVCMEAVQDLELSSNHEQILITMTLGTALYHQDILSPPVLSARLSTIRMKRISFLAKKRKVFIRHRGAAIGNHRHRVSLATISR